MHASDNVLAPVQFRHAHADALDWIEKALAVAGFLILIGAFRSLLLTENAVRTGGSPFFQLVSGSIYLSAILVLVARRVPPWAFKVLLYAVPLLVVTLLPLVSTLWSQAPEPTLRRAITLILSSSFAVFILVRFDLRTTFNLFAIAFGIFVVTGALATLIPGLGITPSGRNYSGALRGLSGNKNIFGRTLAFAISLMLVGLVTRLFTWRKVVALLIVVAFGLLILSRSATSLICAVATFPIAVLLYACLGGQFFRTRVKLELGMPLLLITVIAGAIAITFGREPVLEALGRDPTLTGRTDLWRWASQINEDRRWLGSGFRAFWIDDNTLYYSEYFWALDSDGERSDNDPGPDHAHSGYVDMYLELGIVGSALLAICFLSAFLTLQQTLVRGNYQLGLAFSTTIVFLLIYDASERSFLQYSEEPWFMFVLLYLSAIKSKFISN